MRIEKPPPGQSEPARPRPWEERVDERSSSDEMILQRLVEEIDALTRTIEGLRQA